MTLTSLPFYLLVLALLVLYYLCQSGSSGWCC